MSLPYHMIDMRMCFRKAICYSLTVIPEDRACVPNQNRNGVGCATDRRNTNVSMLFFAKKKLQAVSVIASEKFWRESFPVVK